MSSAKWRPFYLGLNVWSVCFNRCDKMQILLRGQPFVVLSLLYLMHNVEGSTFRLVGPTSSSGLGGGYQYRSRLEAMLHSLRVESKWIRSRKSANDMHQYAFRKLTRLTKTITGNSSTIISSLYLKHVGKWIGHVAPIVIARTIITVASYRYATPSYSTWPSSFSSHIKKAF